MIDVLSPWLVRYSGTCHQWFAIGASARRVFPTICIHSCNVRAVSTQPGTARSGHAEDPVFSRARIDTSSPTFERAQLGDGAFLAGERPPPRPLHGRPPGRSADCDLLSW